ncbi:MAG: BamA/TamA family outer membrane protein, partial [Halobacteriovoraceae bacterium]|nr:BamA/TamA family outer membrane protein [Halobacteriovoraceae bacterium]
ENLKSIIEEKYKTLGYSFTNAQISIKKNIGRNGDINYYYYVDISVNKRVKFNELLFVGNNYFSNKELRDFFFTEASEQAASNILDQKYFSSFSALLKEKYIKAGFLSATIDKPVTFYDYSTEKMSVTFRIREGSKTKVESFKILGIPFDQEKLLKNKLTNKIGLGFNPIAFQDDLKLINNYLKDSGYYFSKILNTKSLGIVEYNSDDTMVKINIEVEAGPKIYVDDIIIIGNQKTRKKLILREVKLEPGALVTSSKIEHAQANLLALGIFSSVQIKPVTQNSTKTDILVFVREKDFGLVEFSPGLRTDLGFKVGANINYKNLDGMNKRVSFNSVINRRFDLTDLAEERKDSKSLIEFDSSLNFLEDKIFNSEFDLRLSLSKSRKRFYAYDVDLQRAAYTVSYDFTRWFNISFRQQIESVSQFNAIQDSNHGHFQIGSFTPALKIDLRNRSINPTSGAEFTLSSEYATPLFFSQSGSGSTINYYKLVNRNKFYIPVTDHSVVAISTSYGIQENYANNRNDNNEVEGYIPPIRVFRLSGSDIIRGFEDTEMNYLADEGKDISEVEITNRAYMVNFKLEPRFYLSDTTVFGVFYDAGRVFVNDFEADELRSSVGLSFKLVTPVGTLDFDYGIKTLRKRDSNGNLENPGKLHVSIGFF